MRFDAVILAGGRASRLGGTPKASLVRGSETLLQLALAAVEDAHRTVVVGDVGADVRYTVTRESPPFSGPVAGLAAGIDALGEDASPLVLVLACDMPDAAVAVRTLRRAAADGTVPGDGVIATDVNGRDQYLAAFYSRRALTDRLRAMTVTDAAVRDLVRGLELERVAVPPGSTDDVDTWQDAEKLGVTMTEQTL